MRYRRRPWCWTASPLQYNIHIYIYYIVYRIVVIGAQPNNSMVVIDCVVRINLLGTFYRVVSIRALSEYNDCVGPSSEYLFETLFITLIRF